MKSKITLIVSIFVFFSLTVNSQTIWDGPSITVTKSNSADWTLEENQDRITPTVWLTRKNAQGQFNIAQETGYSFGSPVDTEWGWGTTADIGSITFYNWEEATNDFNPYGDHLNISDGPMVLHLITDNIYIDLQYNSWTSGNNGGGFSYTRSSDPALSLNNFESRTLKIYPNPTSNFLNIKNLKENQNIEIYDILGNKVIELYYIIDTTIDISNLSKGLYFLKVNAYKESIIKILKK
ncbi:MAG: T9SS type A sorting domain-containing protein [Flavobacteriaceae bacterium]|nr:T9SS type A sorting domain-containing protein [Flavobacteriaceae bacterium]